MARTYWVSSLEESSRILYQKEQTYFWVLLTKLSSASRRYYPFERRRAHEGARAKIPLQIHGQLSLESCCGSLRCSKGGEAAWEEVCSCCGKNLKKARKQFG